MSAQAIVTMVLAMLGMFLGKSPVYQFLAPLLVQLVTAYDAVEAGTAADLTSAVKVNGTAYVATISLTPAGAMAAKS